MSGNGFDVILTMAPGPDRDNLARELAEEEYSVELCDAGDSVWELLNSRPGPHVLLLDTEVSGADTEDVLDTLNRPGVDVCTILLTDETTANMGGVWAGLGAWGFLIKPVNWILLTAYLERIQGHFKLQRENSYLKSYLCTDSGVQPKGVYYSMAMKKVLKKAREAADTDAPILLLGEPGTDKQALAHEIHTTGNRRHAPFISIDCSVLTPAEIEAALFGAMPQDIDDTAMPHQGYIVCAHAGTLFLNEVAALPAFAQEKLLELLRDSRKDDAKPYPDVRLIAASSANLALEVGRELFDSELYMLMKDNAISLPPLRERPEDVPELARRYLALAGLDPVRKKHLTDPAIDVLANYYWPGNEKELRNVVQRAAFHATGDTIERENVLPLLSPMSQDEPAISLQEPQEFAFPSLALPLKDVERAYIARVLKNNNFHRKSTAQSLGISRKTLYSKIKEYDLVNKIVRKDPDI